MENLTIGNIVIDNTLNQSGYKQCGDFEQFHTETIYTCHFIVTWYFSKAFCNVTVQSRSFFCRGRPISTGLAVMQFPDLKTETEQIKSRSEQMYQLLLLCFS